MCVVTQLRLFGDEPSAAAPAVEDDARLAARLPEGLSFGTMSWSFPGWQGVVYAERRSQAALARDGLAEYARHPLLRTVEIDRGFYAPVPEADLARYAAQLPAGYRCCLKAPQAVTAAALYDAGASEARANPAFLSVARLRAEVLDPVARTFAGHLGPLILEFPRAPRGLRAAPDAFAERLDAFLGALPGGLELAVELRDPELLVPAYAQALGRRGAAHVYSYWSGMPLPSAQARVVPPERGPFVLLRLLLPPGSRYEERREAFAPFDRILAADEPMRREAVGLAQDALRRGQRAVILVNNKAEGSAPLTVRALAGRLARRP